MSFYSCGGFNTLLLRNVHSASGLLIKISRIPAKILIKYTQKNTDKKNGGKPLKLKHIFTLLFILLIFAGILACTLLESIEEKQKHDIYNLKQEIVPLKFSMQKEGNNILFVYTFYDLNKNAISQDTTLCINGDELFLECIVAELNGYTKAVFPFRVYSNVVPPSQGFVIVKEYDKDGFPLIFAGVKSRQAKYLKKIYTNICNKKFTSNWFYSAVHKKAESKKEKQKLAVRIKGGIEILRDE